ncbi:MAG: hypothetical protein P8Y36_07155 [Alphaproteobacteria bacterium]
MNRSCKSFWRALKQVMAVRVHVRKIITVPDAAAAGEVRIPDRGERRHCVTVVM